jgi:MFS family permease
MRALVAVIVIDMLGSGLYLPVSLLYFTKVAGIPLATTGLSLSAAQLLTLPLPLLIGRLVDRFGSRAVVLWALLLQAGGFAGFLLVGDALALFIAAGLAAVGQRAYWSSIFTLIADLASSADRDHAYAKSSAAQNAGIGVGALVAAGLLAVGEESVFVLVIVLNALTFALSALVLWLRIPRRTHDAGSASADQVSVGGPLRDRPFLVLVAANTVFALCSGLLALSLPVYVEHLLGRPSAAVGVLLALNTAALALCQTFVVKRLTGRRRTRVMCVAGIGWAGWGVLMASTFAIPVEWVVVTLFPVTLVYTVAELLHAPASNALASELGPERERGRYMSTFQFSFALSGVVAPAFFTQLFSWQPVAPWLIVSVGALAAGLAVVALESRLPAAAVAAQSSEPARAG